MERETKNVKSPAGKEVVVKTYLTARERNKLRSALFKDASLDTAGNAVQGVNASVLEDAERVLLEQTLVSYDGKTENLVDTLLVLPTEEYDFVIKQANETVGDMSGDSEGFTPAK